MPPDRSCSSRSRRADSHRRGLRQRLAAFCAVAESWAGARGRQVDRGVGQDAASAQRDRCVGLCSIDISGRSRNRARSRAFPASKSGGQADFMKPSRSPSIAIYVPKLGFFLEQPSAHDRAPRSICCDSSSLGVGFAPPHRNGPGEGLCCPPMTTAGHALNLNLLHASTAGSARAFRRRATVRSRTIFMRIRCSGVRDVAFGVEGACFR